MSFRNKDEEREFNEAPAVEPSTRAQRGFIEGLLERQDLDLRDALVEAGIEEIDEIQEVADLGKAQASILLDWLTQL